MPIGVRSCNRGIKRVEPMKLEEYFDRYGTDKRRALQEIMTSLEDSVREMLAESSRLTKSIEPVESVL